MNQRASVQAARISVVRLGLGVTVGLLFSVSGLAQPATQNRCRLQATAFDGWQAEQISNRWLRLTVVPQLGGRLMQVEFGGHPYLFVNPRYKGQYIPPSDPAAQSGWINYGGDKIWPLPEGTQDERQWAGPVSGPLDDGVYKLTIVSQDTGCALRLSGPPDPQTGIQYSREIRLGDDSPEIAFHAEMKNASSHPIAWSLQSVTQYDLSDAGNGSGPNQHFWAFAPLNPHSAYLQGYHVRSGLTDDPSFSVRNGLFSLHWLDLQNEVWLDSTAGWIAIMDGTNQYAMVERFRYQNVGNYPGKASVIFYKNGPAVQMSQAGVASLTSADPRQAPYYMEAELNSPIAELQPGETYAFDTHWFPTRLQGELFTVTDAGAAAEPLVATWGRNTLVLSGAFGVFYSGKLVARLYDGRGVQTAITALQTVSPLQFVNLHQEIAAAPGTTRVSLHLLDEQGDDKGSLGEAQVTRGSKYP